MLVRNLKLATRVGVTAAALTLAQFAGASTPANAGGLLVVTPLTSQVPVVRPEPVSQDVYSMTTGHNYWSVVAIRPQGTSDLNLSLYDANNAFLNFSLQGINNDGFASVDFVAVDSNAGRRAFPANYTARAFVQTTSPVKWNYNTEFVDPGQLLSAGDNSVFLGSANVANVRDIYVAAGQTVTIKAQPNFHGQYPEIFLMSSTAGKAFTFVRSRSEAVASAVAPGQDRAAQFSYTAPAAGYYGFVIVNRTLPLTGANPGPGHYTVKVSFA